MPITATKYTMQLLTEILVFNADTRLLKYIIDDMQDGKWSNTVETVDATGMAGAKIDSADRAKASKLTATNGFIVGALLADQVGGTVTSGAYVLENFVEMKEVTSATSVTVSYKPQGATGAEIEAIYKILPDGGQGKSYLQAATASASAFAYAPTTGIITLPTGAFVAGDSVLIQYAAKANDAQVVSNNTDAFTENSYIIAKGWAKASCNGKSYPAWIIFPNAKISGNFDFSFGKEFAVHAFEAEAMENCHGKRLWDFVVFDNETLEKVV